MHTHILKILEHERTQLMLLLNLLDQTIDAYKKGGVLTSEKEEINDISENSGDYLQSKLQWLQKYTLYNPALNTRNKVLYILKAEKRFLHVREIAKIAWQLENEKPFETYIKTISPALSMLKRTPGAGVVSIEVEDSHFNTFWGYGEWLTKTGSIRPQFMYNELQLTNNRKQTVFRLSQEDGHHFPVAVNT